METIDDPLMKKIRQLDKLIHGYNRGTSLRSMIHDWYQYDPKVKRIVPGDNPGITVLVLKELY